MLAKAKAVGMPLEDYVLSMLEAAARPMSHGGATPEQRALAYQEWAAGHRPTPPLSDYAVSREAMYDPE